MKGAGMVELDVYGTDEAVIENLVSRLKADGFRETFRWGPASGGWLRIVLVRNTQGPKGGSTLQLRTEVK